MSSIDPPHPHPQRTIKSLQQQHSHTSPPLGIDIGASSLISPTTYAHPLSSGSPNQGHGIAPWSKAWSCLRQSYVNTPLLFQHWISTFPTYFEPLTTHIHPIKPCLPFWLCNAQYAWVKICITKESSSFLPQQIPQPWTFTDPKHNPLPTMVVGLRFLLQRPSQRVKPLPKTSNSWGQLFPSQKALIHFLQLMPHTLPVAVIPLILRQSSPMQSIDPDLGQ